MTVRKMKKKKRKPPSKQVKYVMRFPHNVVFVLVEQMWLSFAVLEIGATHGSMNYLCCWMVKVSVASSNAEMQLFGHLHMLSA